MFTKVKTDKEIASIRVSGQMLASVLKSLVDNVQVGMSTKDIDRLAATELKSLGGKPAFLGYHGFPGVICVSLNEEVVHGLPGDKIVKAGDLLSLDFGVDYQGMITDSAITLFMGDNPSADIARLLHGTEAALSAAINSVKDGVRVGDISAATEKVLIDNQLGIVRDLVGHGVGHFIHEEPNIPNYGSKGTGPALQAGMTIAIEPMAMLGGEDVITLDDGWTVATTDHSLSAHFEHTVLITDLGAEVITSLP